MPDYDAVVVGAGPNGLAAAITVARAGGKVLLLEGGNTVGGGLRSAALTLPGYVHDICATVLALGVASPFFRDLPADLGLAWVQPEMPLAHPFDDGSAAALCRSVDETARRLGPDGPAYRRLMAPLVDRWQEVLHEFLGPLRFPRSPLLMARFGLRALPPAALLARTLFRQEPARALFAGLAGHAIMPLEQPATAAFGLMLGMLAHAVGWPVARGGSQNVADTLAAYFERLGGQIETGRMVTTLDELPPARATLLDITPRQFVALAGEKLPPGYRSRLHRYRYGPGVFKLDWALDGPIPWTADACRRAGTVHLGPTLAAMSASEKAMWNGRHAEAPYVILVQPTVCDPSRAPAGKHVGWAYCHVPHGATVDMTAAIEAQVERFAPGFRDRILARHAMNTRDYEAHNPNYVGGDINGGIQDLRQLYTRPVARWNPYTTPLDGVYLCSSSTPPGGGTHGMSGLFAAQTALRHM